MKRNYQPSLYLLTLYLSCTRVYQLHIVLLVSISINTMRYHDIIIKIVITLWLLSLLNNFCSGSLSFKPLCFFKRSLPLLPSETVGS